MYSLSASCISMARCRFARLCYVCMYCQPMTVPCISRCMVWFQGSRRWIVCLNWKTGRLFVYTSLIFIFIFIYKHINNHTYYNVHLSIAHNVLLLARMDSVVLPTENTAVAPVTSSSVANATTASPPIPSRAWTSRSYRHSPSMPSPSPG